MHFHFIVGCTKEINTSLLSFQKGRGMYCMHGLTTSMSQCAQTAEQITMECFKLMACLSCENVRDYLLISIHTLKA